MQQPITPSGMKRALVGAMMRGAFDDKAWARLEIADFLSEPMSSIAEAAAEVYFETRKTTPELVIDKLRDHGALHRCGGGEAVLALSGSEQPEIDDATISLYFETLRARRQIREAEAILGRPLTRKDCEDMGLNPDYSDEPPPPNEAPAIIDKPKVPRILVPEPYQLAASLMQDEHILRDANDNLYRYNGTHWVPITIEKLKALVSRYDEDDETSNNRCNEAANIVARKNHADEPIEWNSVGFTEIPMLNGMLDFSTHELRPHKPEDRIDRVIPIEYKEKATCLLWIQLLEDWFGDDDDYLAKVAALQEFFGYTLMQNARYKKALFLLGESDCGKSQVSTVLRYLVGGRNTCSLAIDTLNDQRAIAPIKGKLLNLCTDLPEDSLIADGGFKQLVSTEEPVQIDEKFKAPMLYVPTCKHVFVTNVLPDVNDQTYASFNRLLIIRFNRVFSKQEQDKRLSDKLEKEMQGILNWALDGARRLVENNGDFTPIGESDKILEEYRFEQNIVLMFIESMLHRHKDNRIDFKVFCDRFNEWNPSGRKWAARTIGKALSSLRLERVSINGKRYVKGIGDVCYQ
jgi:P4 family phage/plasmid primase-like protien